MWLLNFTTWQQFLESSARLYKNKEGQARPTPQNLSLILSPVVTRINHSGKTVLLPFLSVGVEDGGALPSLHRLVRRHFAFCSQSREIERVGTRQLRRRKKTARCSKPAILPLTDLVSPLFYKRSIHAFVRAAQQWIFSSTQSLSLRLTQSLFVAQSPFPYDYELGSLTPANLPPTH